MKARSFDVAEALLQQLWKRGKILEDAVIVGAMLHTPLQVLFIRGDKTLTVVSILFIY